MTARLAIALVTAGGLLAQTAAAYACGGGSDSNDGNSSSSSSSSDSGSSYNGGSGSVSVEPACVDATDVNGYRSCSHYGDWGTAAALPAISFELSTWTAQIDLRDVDVRGSIHHSYGPDYSYRVVGDDLGDEALAIGVKARILGHRRGLYAGVEGGIAGVDAHEVQSMTTPDAMLVPRVSSLFTVGVVAGIEHGVGRFSLGAELMAGGRGIRISSESYRGACEVTETNLAARGIVEARVHADVWATPWLTVGAYAGRDVFGQQSTAGVGIGGHLRAFDGSR